MIAALSTSSPLTSVAFFSEDGSLKWAGEEEAPGRASESCMSLLRQGLESVGAGLGEFCLFVADRGPGSFTGVRVGIVIAKTLGWNYGVDCAGIDAFDLIEADGPAAVPARKGEFFLRIPGEEPVRTTELPANVAGYGLLEQANVYPNARRAGSLLGRLNRVPPEALMPEYRMEPSISTPKRPLSRVHD